MSSRLVEHPRGGYRFLPGIAPYSGGVVAAPGFEIVHATLRRPLPYRQGLDRIRAVLDAESRPVDALCGIELRSPRPFSFEGFSAFNKGYAAILEGWGLFVDGVNPVARTNVAPEVGAESEPVLHGFSYTKPSPDGGGTTFVVAGGGELPEGILEPSAIVRGGDISPEAIAAKAAFVMDLMEARLKGLGHDWDAVNAVDVYTVHPIEPFLRSVLLDRIGKAASREIRWYYSRPPIIDIEFEMDLRGVDREIRIG